MSTSFLDQCRVVCLNYIKFMSNKDVDFQRDDLKNLHDIIEREMEAFDFDVQDFIASSKNLAEMSLNFDVAIIGKISHCVQLLQQGDLTQQNFENALNDLFGESAVESWNQIAMLLHLMYKTMDIFESSKLEEIVDLTVRYLRNAAKNFIVNQGGWENIRIEETEEILTSIVMVQKESSEPRLETDSPPFSMLPPMNDDEESLNSATPPEIVDRPPMTASLMQMMGGGDAQLNINSNGNTGASSDSNEFEMVGSVTSASTSIPSSPKQTLQQSTDISTSVAPLPSEVKPFVEEVPSEPTDPPPDGSTVSDYLPHISIGVAAAAACIGFFMLKKAS